MGPFNAADFQFIIDPIFWNSANAGWESPNADIVIIDSKSEGRAIGNFIYDLTNTNNPSLAVFNKDPIPLSRNNIFFTDETGSDVQEQVCSLQFFGWYFC